MSERGEKHDEAGGPPDARDPEPVPRLPRGRGIKVTGPEIFRIAMYAILLVTVVVLARPCGEAASRFLEQFEEVPDAGPSDEGEAAGNEGEGAVPPGDYVRLSPDMSEDEIRAKIGAARDAGTDVERVEPDEPGEGDSR